MISAVAITYNEADCITTFIESLSFATEIIIVDSYSTDQTVAIAESLGATVIKRSFDNFSNQKNFAFQQATYDWVVCFDADEEVSKALADEILSVVTSENPVAAYRVKRDLYFMGKRIKYSGFQNDTVVRLCQKKRCHYKPVLVHETMAVNGTTKSLRTHSKHHSYKGFDHYNKKLTQYSELKARMLFDKNMRPNAFHFFIKPGYRFLYQYIVQGGFLDGKAGFILAFLSGFTVFKRYLFLWLKYRI